MDFYIFLPKLLNMSMTASVAIICVLLLRLLLKKAPKVISYALWAVVLFRLLCPVSISSGFSLFGLMNAPTEDTSNRTSTIAYVPENIVHTEYPAVTLPIPGVSEAINITLPQGEEQFVADPLEAPITIGTYVWLIGVLVMAVYSVTSYFRLRSKLLIASPLRENIYLADEITTPFVMGLIRPKIYLPSDIQERQQSYIILHEQHHIRRGDHIMKALAFLALSIHWFNPLVWVAFVYAGKDMEMSCDEAVVKKLGDGILTDYTASLLSLATGKTIIAGVPLAFGEGDTGGRIRNLANWKKPTLWVVLVAAAACVALGIGLLTNPDEEDAPDNNEDGYYLFGEANKELSKGLPKDEELGLISETVSVTGTPLVMAKEVVSKQFAQMEGSGYINWRIDSLTEEYYYQTSIEFLNDKAVTVYRLEYSFLVNNPENLKPAENSTIDEEGWVSAQSPNTYLCVVKDGGALSYRMLTVNDYVPGDEAFTEELKLLLGVGPETAEDYYSVATSASAKEVEEFAFGIKENVVLKDWESLSVKLAYPIQIGEELVKSNEEFLAMDIDGKLNQAFVDGIAAESCREMFCNYQGIMMGATGQIWIAGVDDGAGQWELKVIALNGLEN